MFQTVFITVTDYDFLPGTLATVNSILMFHPNTTVFVIENTQRPLSEPQRECLRRDRRVALLSSEQFERDGRHMGAWELKAYAAHDLCGGFDVIVGIDSDCILCGPIADEIELCYETGGFLGGKDGDGADYDDTYRVYGIEPEHNPKYMSTSLYIAAVTPENKRSLARWAECCGGAVFNGAGPYPGHGDQGVLNAVLFSEDRSARVEPLENSLWSQHWVYWSSIIDYQNGTFINLSAGGAPQRSFHCGGAEKFWAREHRDRVLSDHSLQTYPYCWFLAMLWFGPLRNWDIDPYRYLPPNSHHLVEDLILFFSQIRTIYPEANLLWEHVTDPLLDRLVEGIHRMLSLGGGSMTDLITLIAANPQVRRSVEIGSYLGGSLLTLATRFMNRDIDFFAVESFMGNKDGKMDGHSLPSRAKFVANLTKYPSLRAKLIAGDSVHVAAQFADGSIDFLFVDGCHETDAVLADIDAWHPKLSPHGIVAGDDYTWDSVRTAVRSRFNELQITPSGDIWWTANVM